MPASKYAAGVAPNMKRFLISVLQVSLGWVALLGAAFALSVFIGDRIDNEPIRWALNIVTLFGSIKLATILQNRILSHADPDGGLRAQVTKFGADAEDEDEEASDRTRRPS